MSRPAGAPVASAGQPETGAQMRDGHQALGLRCRVCGLDEVPWPRTAYCSERCRRRAAYLTRRQRLRAAGRQDEGWKSRGTMR
jgi:hypothetical protein